MAGSPLATKKELVKKQEKSMRSLRTRVKLGWESLKIIELLYL
jgi:hypothetical protein